MAEEVDYKNATSIYDFSAKDNKGINVSLENYRGHMCIIVNVASKCVFTNVNYTELNEIYEKYGESKGLRILAFPCNQFMNQEPSNNEQICTFFTNRNAKFDLFAKICVNGANTHPLWNYLKSQQGGILGSFIKWNFTKFVIDREGQVIARFGPMSNPSEMLPLLEKYLEPEPKEPEPEANQSGSETSKADSEENQAESETKLSGSKTTKQSESEINKCESETSQSESGTKQSEPEVNLLESELKQLALDTKQPEVEQLNPKTEQIETDRLEYKEKQLGSEAKQVE